MNEVVSDNVQNFLEASNRINSKTISLTRFQILVLLAYFRDGVQYRELKASLDISDGKLISNLKLLELMGYVKCFKTEIDRKKLDVYALTGEGKRELDKMTRWMDSIRTLSQRSGGE